jgi:hypothetical protein
MEQSALRLIKRQEQFLPQANIETLPGGMRGIYSLYNYTPKTNAYNVVYIGMTWSGRRGGIRGRLKKHYKKKKGLWTHCSVFEVWDNIHKEEIIELEGIFRHIYHRDERANSLNKQKSFNLIKRVPKIISKK